jgi:hypothetical protein
VDVELANGHRLAVHPDTPLLLADEEQYLWKSAERLLARSRVCAGLADSRRLSPTVRKVINYWYGYMFSTGQVDGDQFVFPFRPMHKGRKTKAHKEIEAMDKLFDVAVESRQATCSGPKFHQLMKSLGVWYDGTRMARVPPGCSVKPTIQRRAFCKALVDSTDIPPTYNRWMIDLHTVNRVRDAQRMFRSVGVDSRIKHQTQLWIGQWLAAFELGTETPYPTNTEIGSMGVPSGLLDDYLNVRRKNNQATGITGVLVEMLQKDRYAVVHPLALRASYAQMGKKPVTPIYDSTLVTKALPRMTKGKAYYVEMNHTDHQFEADGYLIGDSVNRKRGK